MSAPRPDPHEWTDEEGDAILREVEPLATLSDRTFVAPFSPRFGERLRPVRARIEAAVERRLNHHRLRRSNRETHPDYNEDLLWQYHDGAFGALSDVLAALAEIFGPAGTEKGERQIDPKFHVAAGQIIKTRSGEVLPEDEPLILFRGRDHLALATLEHYRELSRLDGCNDYHLSGIDERIGAFAAYKRDHPEKMKQPGVTRGAPWKPALAPEVESALIAGAKCQDLNLRPLLERCLEMAEGRCSIPYHLVAADLREALGEKG